MNNFENKIGYTFKDKGLLETALRHSSVGVDNYERLEFVGDSLLDYIVAEYLYHLNNDKVGQMSVMRSNLVSTNALSNVVLQNGFDKYVSIADSLLNANTKILSIYADIVESVVCAIYLDGGIAPAKEFVYKFILSNQANLSTKDYKTLLQELLAAINPDFDLEYRTINQTGPSHDTTFEIELFYNDKAVAFASGKSKKNAHQICAKIFYEKLKNQDINKK